MWLSLLACTAHVPPETAGSGFVPLASSTPTATDCPGVEAALRGVSGVVEVVVDIEGPVVLPAALVVSARTDLSVQGAIPATELCALGAVDGVVRVRSPWLASPK